MAAAGFITVGICIVHPELCGAVLSGEDAAMGVTRASFTLGGLVLKNTTNVYALALVGVGIPAAAPSCTIALRHRSNNKAKGWCKGSLSAIHTGARIALSYKFSDKLGSGALKWGWPTANQVAYSMSFTAINGSASMVSMALGDSWSSFSTGRKVGASFLAVGIAFLRSMEDMFIMRWLEGFSAFQREDGSLAAAIHPSPTGHNVPWKSASRIGEVVVALYGLDLAAEANRRQRWLTWKEVGCQILDTTLYQGIRVGVANAQNGATWGRVPGAFGSGWLGVNPRCGGDYDSFF
jgi:hypothetical protein